MTAERSLDADLIRYRIEKRLAGRRDLLLHALVYIGVAILFATNVTWYGAQGYVAAAAFWAIPLALHGLRYYYRCGRGAVKRADEIERALDEQQERAGIDQDEELLIEERLSKRILARRIVVAHGLTSPLFFLAYTLALTVDPSPYFDLGQHLLEVGSWLCLAFALHAARFFFVHGRRPGGRALKIDAAIERAWQSSRERSRARREQYDESALMDLGDARGRRMRLTDDGEFADDDNYAEAASSVAVRR